MAERGIPNSIWDTYSSFANTFGGVILLGVEENKETHELIPKGVNDAHQMISDFWNTMNNPTKISANILLDHHVYNPPFCERHQWGYETHMKPSLFNLSSF